MGNDSTLYQLMDFRTNGVINGIVNSDGMDLSKEIRLLIDRYISEQNALCPRFADRTERP